MKVGIIGASGVLGSAVRGCFPQAVSLKRDAFETTKQDHEFALIFVCAPSGLKWYANKNPDDDLREVEALLTLMSRVKTGRYILFSTIDVLAAQVDTNNSYGANRAVVENYVLNSCHGSVVRLGTLLAPFIKKNFLMDIRNKNAPYLPNSKSKFQFSNLYNLGDLLKLVTATNFEVFNFYSPSISIQRLTKLLNLQHQNFAFCNMLTPSVTYDFDSSHTDAALHKFNLRYNNIETCVGRIEQFLCNIDETNLANR